MVLGNCTTVQYGAWYLYHCTVWCLVLVPECVVWCLVLVPISTAQYGLGTCTTVQNVVLGTYQTVQYGAWYLYLEVLYSMVLGTCTWKYFTIWCLVLVPISTAQYGAWYNLYLEVMYCSVLHVFLHPLPEESLHAVHVVLLEQRVGWLGEPKAC
jgi:hypothetical protein